MGIGIEQAIREREGMAADLAEGKRLAMAVVEAWESGDLAGAVNELQLWAEGDK